MFGHALGAPFSDIWHVKHWLLAFKVSGLWWLSSEWFHCSLWCVVDPLFQAVFFLVPHGSTKGRLRLGLRATTFAALCAGDLAKPVDETWRSLRHRKRSSSGQMNQFFFFFLWGDSQILWFIHDQSMFYSMPEKLCHFSKASGNWVLPDSDGFQFPFFFNVHLLTEDAWIMNHAQVGTGLYLNNCWRGLQLGFAVPGGRLAPAISELLAIEKRLK